MNFEIKIALVALYEYYCNFSGVIMRPLRPHAFAAAVSFMFALAGNARASTILSSYPNVVDGASFAFSSSKWEAVGFDTGVTGSYDLTSVVMRLSSITPGQVSTAIYESGIKTKLGGVRFDNGERYEYHYEAPSLLIGSESLQTVNEESNYSFSFSDVVLKPNTLYWIVFKAVGDESFKYYENDFARIKFDPATSSSNWTDLYKSETGAAIFDFASTPCSRPESCPNETLGFDWAYHSGLNIIAINGIVNTVPEPTSSIVTGLVMAAFVAARKRGKKFSGQEPRRPGA